MITLNENRIGKFTSSEIYRLLGNGEREMTNEELIQYKEDNPKGRKKTIEDVNILSDAALSYIDEKIMEGDLCRSIDSESDAISLRWGKHMEKYAFLHLRKNNDFMLVSDETKVHPIYNKWAGSVDIINENQAGDIKCPYTLKSFIGLIRPIYDGLIGMDAMNAIRFGYTRPNGMKVKAHQNGEKYYQQIVSNSCIHGLSNGVLVVYMPYKHELLDIQDNCEGDISLNWLYFKDIESLPYLNENKKYKNINIISFNIPIEDKMHMENKIKLASEILNLK